MRPSIRNTLTTLVAFASVLLGACSLGHGAGEFSSALGRKLQAERPTEVNLANVTSERWEELFVFGPYSPRERNCQLLQLSWFECRITFPSSVNEGEYILVFRAGKKVTHFEHHPRVNGDFYSQTARTPFPIKRSEATFTVTPVSSAPPHSIQWFSLEHKG